MASQQQEVTLLYKKNFGVADTQDSKAVVQESIPSRPRIIAAQQILAQPIPISAPIDLQKDTSFASSNGERWTSVTTPYIVYYSSIRLAAINLYESYWFQGATLATPSANILSSAIPTTYGDGTYTVNVYDCNAIPLLAGGTYPWTFDADGGILKFYSFLNAFNSPPRVSFYRYEGIYGFSSESASTIGAFTSNTSNWAQTLFQNNSNYTLSTFQGQTTLLSNTSNWAQNLLFQATSSSLSSINNTSNWAQNLFQSTSSVQSTFSNYTLSTFQAQGIFISNTSNWTKTLYDISTPILSTGVYAINSSNFLYSTILSRIVSTVAGGGTAGFGTGSVDIGGTGRAITFSSIYMQTSTIQALQATIGQGTISNLIGTTASFSNLYIPQPVSAEWIAFGNTADGTSLLLRSTTGNAWFPSASPFLGGEFNSVVFNGAYWLAVGTDQNNVYSAAKSYDGLVWTFSPGPFPNGLATCLAWNGSLWVAMGLDVTTTLTLATSADGVTWTTATGPFTNGRGLAVAWNGTQWVASGFSITNANTIAYSSDGLNWTSIVGPAFSQPSGYAGLAWNGTRWVLTGSDATSTYTIAYSSDGINWTRIAGPFTGGYGTSVIWGGTKFVATGRSADGSITIGVSTDGITWTGYGDPFTGGYGFSVAWNGSLFVASGFSSTSGNVLATSTDGITWNGLSSTFNGTTILFATTIAYAKYPKETSLTIGGNAQISSMTANYFGTWYDAVTYVVVDL
jgi:hypothetical protein